VHRSFAVARGALAVAALLVCIGVEAQAPPRPKPPPRLPPSPSETARIPAGVDTGSPGSSDSVPLGTPVPPTLGADRGELRTRSAAARAAARPKTAASGADCTRAAGADRAGVKASAPALRAVPRGAAAAPPAPVASGATRLDC
jgi:hypothetical protein